MSDLAGVREKLQAVVGAAHSAEAMLRDFAEDVVQPAADHLPRATGDEAPAPAEATGITLTDEQRRICERVINVFETGTVAGRYGAISIYADGPNDIRQITYGRSQTTEYGNLRELVEMYVGANGAFSEALRPFVSQIGRVPLVDNDAFKTLLRRAGNEDPVMRATQDVFFERRYFRPALRWAGNNGFTLPLSVLVIYDSFIHSGSIREDLRNRFPERPPAQGGDEKTWIAQYVDVRHDWLTHHHRPAVRASNYRTRDLQREIAAGSWDLARRPFMANGVPVYDTVDGSRLSTGAATAADATSALSVGEAAPLPVDDETVLRALGQPRGLTGPVERLIRLRNERYPDSRPRYWGVVNFGLHSSKPRLFVFDVSAQSVAAYLCAHGRGSEGPTDDGFASVFSNTPGSEATSLGIYRCAETYESDDNGRSMRLDGLEPTNSNARARLIVMHGAWYVSQDVVNSTGRIGRSQGCPALDHQHARTVIEQLRSGSLLMHWDGR
ncbi:MAG: murein L,D-transpeptidase catalytic domain family protein [Bauldia sp.]|nr:murein L,D-transpeptidase catalytic domain family protein [Bauldia sp.]